MAQSSWVARHLEALVRVDPPIGDRAVAIADLGPEARRVRQQMGQRGPLGTRGRLVADRALLDRDGGLESERGQAARTCLYLFERDAAVGLLKGG